MEKNKRWHLGLILTVIALTAYSILPTVIYYAQPLQEPISASQAQRITMDLERRLEREKSEAAAWVHGLLKELHIAKASVADHPEVEDVLTIHFEKSEDCALFKNLFARAEAALPQTLFKVRLIPEASDEKSQLSLVVGQSHLAPLSDALSYLPIKDSSGQIEPRFVDFQLESMTALVKELSQPTVSHFLNLTEAFDSKRVDGLDRFSQLFLQYHRALANHPAAHKRALAAFTQGALANKSSTVKQAIEALEELKGKIKEQKLALVEAQAQAEKGAAAFTVAQQEQLNFYQSKEESLLEAIALLKKHQPLVAAGKKEVSLDWLTHLAQSLKPQGAQLKAVISLQGLHPLFESVACNWKSGTIELIPYGDLEGSPNDRVMIEQLLIDEATRVFQAVHYNLSPGYGQYSAQFYHAENPYSLIALDGKILMDRHIQHIAAQVAAFWNPSSELAQTMKSRISYQIDAAIPACRLSIKDGLTSLQKSGADESSQDIFYRDLSQLQALLYALGYTNRMSSSSSADAQDLVFENRDCLDLLVHATREALIPTGKAAIYTLELGTLKQRLYRLNQIETQEHAELLKWKNDYDAALNHPQRHLQPLYVKPSKSPLLSNLMLSLKKYFRGDERKVLNWGLDLSGGKTIDVAFYDHRDSLVTDPEMLKIAINELYARVNKLGVSEVAIRLEGDHVTVDFPGSQHLSAKELIQTSAMTFHVVNEKFSTSNPGLAASVHQFLQQVWNRALLQQRFDLDSIQAIAQDLLSGGSDGERRGLPRTEAAKIVKENGLVLGKASLENPTSTQNSLIVPLRIDRAKATAAHPLMIVYANSALEGAHLENIRSGSDQKEGNFLSFAVKSQVRLPNGSAHAPQEHLAAWTGRFCEEAVRSSEQLNYTRGHGYRMAVVLNGEIISAPHLNAAIKESGQITGQFSLNEIRRLESDLKAGSMTFKPRVLSEKNVSPDLSDQERSRGIAATLVALSLVVVTMVVYYRFAGVVAAVAVIFNLMIMWAVLQNIQAALTLAGLAGVVLTIGMAVDANVLVFERIKEELGLHQRLTSALESGYSKAFSAIIDSNLTTILAALVLLNFDSGPVKGFAVTLIIGVVSSLFTALFMTRCFFRWWLKAFPKTEMRMMHWIRAEKVAFVRYYKLAVWAVVAFVGLGIGAAFVQKDKLLGMDFTGGYTFHVKISEDASVNGRTLVEHAFRAAGIPSSLYTLRQLNDPNHLKVFLSPQINWEEVKGFSSLALDGTLASDTRLFKAYQLLKSADVPLAKSAFDEMKLSFNHVSGQMSETMRNQAIMGIGIALLGILAYIAIRFEWKYAVASTLGLGVDILITLAAVALLNLMGLAIQFDLNMVAALLTIVGYSLNDTIIVFDRIREELKRSPHLGLARLLDPALNMTLSRTLLTSGTTLLVLIALALLGGPSIFGFSFVMAIGVFIGTLSTFFVATPLLLLLEKKDRPKQQIASGVST